MQESTFLEEELVSFGFCHIWCLIYSAAFLALIVSEFKSSAGSSASEIQKLIHAEVP